MEKEFVAYNEALALKELGFDKPCFGYYENKTKELKPTHGLILEWFNDTNDNDGFEWKISAPTFSQAFRWFREKYNIEHINRPVKKFETDKSREISFYIDGYFISNLRFTTDKTYEEAELECLKKLIEIVKEK